MMLRHTIVFLAVAVFAAVGTVLSGSGCRDAPAPQPSDVEYPAAGYDAVEVVPESAPEAASSPCGRACANFKKLGCPEAEPTDGGVSCYRVCVHGATLRKIPAACWATAPTQAALRDCGRIRCIH